MEIKVVCIASDDNNFIEGEIYSGKQGFHRISNKGKEELIPYYSFNGEIPLYAVFKPLAEWRDEQIDNIFKDDTL